ncbi:hypothetical protein MMC28_011123 [Mycoblastus sanguinarius]|nr:hypothetical protein [Mycoblastus sanguinarius]
MYSIFPFLLLFYSLSCATRASLIIPSNRTNWAPNLTVPSPLTNLSLPNSFPVYLPYRLDVPDTDMVLHLGFGLRPQRFNPSHVRGLIAVAQDWIAQQVEIFGPDMLFPHIDPQVQYFYKTLGDGILLEVWNARGEIFFTWESLKDAVEGIRLFVVVGQRFRRCYFKFGEDGLDVGQGMLRRDDPEAVAFRM